MKTILVWVIQCYSDQAPDGTLLDVVVCEMIDESFEKALAKAKKLVSKKQYRLARVIEKELV